MNDFVHLHVHTEYSLLDGAARIKKVVKKAAELGIPAVAITDHGNMFGVLDFYKAAKAAGVKPVLGCEVYVAPRAMQDKEAHLDDSPYHLVLLAENMEGYQNLLKLVSMGYTEGFYYKPRVDKEALRAHSKGLIALSACLAGEVAQGILQSNVKKAREAALEYLSIFGEGNFYLELQDHQLAEQKQVNVELIKLAQETGIPLVATNDTHYLNREDAEVQDVLMCIQTGRTVEEEGRLRFSTEEFYFKTGEEMAMLFGEYPDALSNTVKIAERCNVEFNFGESHLPYYVLPEGYTPDTYVRELCYKGLEQRYPVIDDSIRERMEYELKTISDMGFSEYFLIVWDFIHFSRENKIFVGPGRGSAAGSLVAFSLGITNIDPLKYDLLFERFLNPERVSMPDIDIDFCFERREEVIEYVIRHYGADKVAQIATFGTMAARAAIRDVGRVLNFPYSEVDKVAKLVPTELHITLERALETSPDLKKLYDEDPRIKKLIDMAAALEGMPRHASTHAAGVVISKEPLTHYLPLYRTSDGVISTQFPKDTVEEIGLLKMDLLGLRTLTVIGDAVKIIKRTHEIDVNIDEIPLDDPKTYELLSAGETVGVFQLESSGMRAILKDLRPEVFEDIIALVALYRPGPLGSGMVDDFVKGKHGTRETRYLHPKLEPILKDTYGVILYQEQVMRISSELAGFTLGEADLLRRAMGKKKPEIIAGLRSQFIEGAVKNEVTAEIAGQIFDLMEYFAGYGFNKSHSAAYALVSYQTAYLKANYPLEFMASLLTSVMGTSDKVAVFIEECRRMGMEILPPDVNESRINFTVVGDKIRFGLAAVKNVGRGAIESIIEARTKDGVFTSLQDFCSKVDSRVVNKRVLESLIKGGAFDSFGHRAQLLAALDRSLEVGQQKQKDKQNGQVSFFDLFEESEEFVEESVLPDVPEFSRQETLTLEKEVLGLYITGHPLGEYKELLRNQTSAATTELAEKEDGCKVIIGGIVTTMKKILTRKGDTMVFINLEDLTGSVEVILFPKVFQTVGQRLQPDAMILVKGKLNVVDEGVKVIAETVEFFQDVPQQELYIKMEKTARDKMEQLQKILRSYSGEVPVYLYFAEDKKMIQTNREWWVDGNTALQNDVEALLGPFTSWWRGKK